MCKSNRTSPGLTLYMLALIITSMFLIVGLELSRSAPIEAVGYEDAECQFEGLTCEQGQAMLDAKGGI